MSTQTHPSYLTILALAVLTTGGICVSAGHSSTVARSGQPQTKGFDSRLWQQVYLSETSDERDESATEPPTSIALRQQIGNQRRFPGAGAEQIAAASLADVIVEEQQEQDVVEPSGTVLSDWEMAKLTAPGQNPLTMHTVNSGGPTATTILVGLVAAIVVCGALFSGRE